MRLQRIFLSKSDICEIFQICDSEWERVVFVQEIEASLEASHHFQIDLTRVQGISHSPKSADRWSQVIRTI